MSDELALTSDLGKVAYEPLRIFMGEHYRVGPYVSEHLVKANVGREVEWANWSRAIEHFDIRCLWVSVSRKYRELLIEHHREAWTDNVHKVWCDRVMVVEMTAEFVIGKWPDFPIVGDYLEDAGSSLCELARQVLPFCYDRHRECPTYPRVSTRNVMDGWLLKAVDTGAAGLIDSLDRLRGLSHYDLKIVLQKPFLPAMQRGGPIKFFEHQVDKLLFMH